MWRDICFYSAPSPKKALVCSFLSIKPQTLCLHAQPLSCIRLFATLQTIDSQTPLSTGFPRQEYWSGLPFPPPGDLPDPGIVPASPAFQEDALWLSHWGRPQILKTEHLEENDCMSKLLAKASGFTNKWDISWAASLQSLNQNNSGKTPYLFFLQNAEHTARQSSEEVPDTVTHLRN